MQREERTNVNLLGTGINSFENIYCGALKPEKRPEWNEVQRECQEKGGTLNNGSKEGRKLRR